MRVESYRDAARQRNLGTKQSEAILEKKRVAMRGRHAEEKNPMWKGDQVGYHGIHSWVARYKQKDGSCSQCGETGKTEWANLSRAYQRDLTDWIELCRRCHCSFDRPPGWTREHECCVTCGTTEKRHKGNGECGTCYSRRASRKWRARELEN